MPDDIYDPSSEAVPPASGQALTLADQNRVPRRLGRILDNTFEALPEEAQNHRLRFYLNQCLDDLGMTDILLAYYELLKPGLIRLGIEPDEFRARLKANQTKFWRLSQGLHLVPAQPRRSSGEGSHEEIFGEDTCRLSQSQLDALTLEPPYGTA